MQLTSDQCQALEQAKKFVCRDEPASVMVLRGSAGTGKTTLIKSIIEEVKGNFDNVVVCAPTNKAARVLNRKTGLHAGTIHKLLFKIEEEDGITEYVRLFPKKDERLLIVADEASMIRDRIDRSDSLFGGIRLLSQLLEYFSYCSPGSRLIFVGDPCQLAPIGYESYEKSPALDGEYLRTQKQLVVVESELKEIVRQANDSYILEGATSLRNYMLYGASHYAVSPRFLRNSSACIEKYLEYYSTDHEDRVMKIAWTNRNVNWWNQVMRERLDLSARPLMPGTRVLIDRTRSEQLSTMSKGETGHVFNIDGPVETFANLQFQPVTIMICDEDGVVTREQKGLALLEYLSSYKGGLADEQERHLVKEALRCNDKYRENKRAELDPYVNAFRLRYGYALTCHKAQGCEYENVIVNPFQPQGDLRWL
ncbi:MAG: AAA family ATPase, partial [Chitinophagaceae bacterium]